MRRFAWGGLAAVVALAPAAADAADAQEVFGRYGDRVVQVRILERGTGAKIALGSGFFVSPDGHLITNFHVLSELVHQPEKVRAEIIEEGGATSAIELLDFDVVHDVAIARSTGGEGEAKPRTFLELASEPPQKGARLYSLGNPHDLGSSIVEGTYNGLLEKSLYEKIHFTAPINAGMSGGPAIDAQGRVVGINVSTAGNEVSFLVPAKYAARLRAATLAPGWKPPADFVAVLTQQLLDNQQMLADNLLRDPLPQISLGDYRVPGELKRYFKCWGATSDDDDERYQTVGHQCSTEDTIYVGQFLRAGSIGFNHTLIESEELNPLQFYSLYQSRFASPEFGFFGARNELGNFVCDSAYVDKGASTLKTVLCLRAYKKLHGLYDAVFKAASLDSNHAGVVTSLTMTGVSYDNAALLAQHYLEAMTWNPS